MRGRALAWMGGVLAVSVAIAAWYGLRRARTDALDPPPSQVFLDRRGVPLASYLSTEQCFCCPVRFDQVSPWVILATLAAEDDDFYLHPGVDLRAVARALWLNARAGRIISGASTLSQQLARSIEPRPRTFAGKVREAWGAFRLEGRWSKASIFEAYLNRIDYGNHCRGIEAASRQYFGVSASELSLAQAAALAGIPKSPARYDPYRDPQRVTERQQAILASMRRKGYLDGESFRQAADEPLFFTRASRLFAAPHLLRRLRKEVDPRRERVETTLDAYLQADLQALLKNHLRRLEGRNVTNAALMVMSNRTGEVLAWVGSADFFDPDIQGQVDGVSAKRQPGSTLKPFLYALAFSKGWRPADRIEDAPFRTSDGYAPKNYDEAYHGWVSLRSALACSYNIPAARLAAQVKPRALHSLLLDLGFTSLVMPSGYYGIGLALGDGEVTLPELVAAYGTLARGGQAIPWRALLEPEGTPSAEARQVLDPRICYLVTDILSDPAARAPAFGLNSPLRLPFDFAAKTGTSKDFRDNWAVGYTTDWTVGVWVGNFTGEPMENVSGIMGAGPLLHDAALIVGSRYPSEGFRRPEGIVEREVCAETGMLPGRGCRRRMLEVFDERSLPTGPCTLHGGAPPKTDQGLAILYPRPGDMFKIDWNTPRGQQEIRLRSDWEGPDSALTWKVDGQPVRPSEDGYWWRLEPGWHEVRLTCRSKGGVKEAGPQKFLVVP